MGLFFFRLPLEACRRGNTDTASPLAVVHGEGADPVLSAVNEGARAAGVHPGMGLGAACALVPRLEVLRRDLARETAVLEGLATWVDRFTALVSLVPPAGLLLEVGGSLALFGGLAALRERVETGLSRLGFQASVGTAPTPAAAWLLARAGLAEPVLDRSRLPGRLAEVPLACLDLPEPVLRDLEAMGVERFRDACRLPRDALSRRVGETLIDVMDRALGRRPDARARYVAPLGFARRVDFPVEVGDLAPILAGLRRLLRELAGFLQAKALGVRGLELHLAPRLAPATRVHVELCSASRDPEHLLDLLEKRLERVTLIRPVASLGLRVLGVDVLAPRPADLYDGKAVARDGLHTLIEGLQSRLGPGALCRLALAADHRPERAFTLLPLRDPRTGRAGPAGLRAAECAPAPDLLSLPADAAPAPGPRRGEDRSRPLWLLETPRRIEAEGGHRRERFEISAQAERIESGWWDGYDVRRDYHVARGARGGRYWVYRELGTREWFLHGIFG